MKLYGLFGVTYLPRTKGVDPLQPGNHPGSSNHTMGFLQVLLKALFPYLADVLLLTQITAQAT
jgi:hypothetical protein